MTLKGQAGYENKAAVTSFLFCGYEYRTTELQSTVPQLVAAQSLNSMLEQISPSLPYLLLLVSSLSCCALYDRRDYSFDNIR